MEKTFTVKGDQRYGFDFVVYQLSADAGLLTPLGFKDFGMMFSRNVPTASDALELVATLVTAGLTPEAQYLTSDKIAAMVRDDAQHAEWDADRRGFAANEAWENW